LCGAKKFSKFDERDFLGYQIANWICRRCGLVFMSPRMEEDVLEDFYAAEYRNIYRGQEDPSPNELRTQTTRAQHFVDVAQDWIRNCNAHLDIGCSSGLLMEAMRNEYSCQTVGIEYSSAHREYCARRGLTVYRTAEELRAATNVRFDIVTMSHVLEHLTDPVDYLNSLRDDLLNTNGYLHLEVPNLYAHPCFELAHNFAFSPETLKETIQKAGYELIYMKTHGITKGNIPFYITAVARALPAQDSYRQYEVKSTARLVRVRRSYGINIQTPATYAMNKGFRIAKRALGISSNSGRR